MSKSITGSFVAFNRVLVAEDHVTAFQRPVVMKMIDRLPQHDTKISYQSTPDVYHFLVDDGMVYGCVSTIEYENRKVYGFLSEVSGLFQAQFGSTKSVEAINPVTCRNFSVTLAAVASAVNDDKHRDRIGEIQEQLNSVTAAMLQNIDNVIERGEVIDNLCDRTEVLRDEAQGFHTNSTALRRATMKQMLIRIVAALIVAGIIGLVITVTIIDFRKKKNAIEKREN